jgi:hypothetical protein
MFIYFYILERFYFHDVMQTPLSQSHRVRSFGPCLDLCRYLLEKNSAISKDALVHAILSGLPFDRVFWHGLIGECLVYGAEDIPRLSTAPESLCCLLAPHFVVQLDGPRADFPPILQVHFGTRDLKFGSGYHRPEHAGLNDEDDIERLTTYLEKIDPAAWKPRDLEPLASFPDDEQRAEELADVRDWFPSLVELYQSARARDQVVVCEKP